MGSGTIKSSDPAAINVFIQNTYSPLIWTFFCLQIIKGNPIWHMGDALLSVTFIKFPMINEITLLQYLAINQQIDNASTFFFIKS